MAAARAAPPSSLRPADASDDDEATASSGSEETEVGARVSGTRSTRHTPKRALTRPPVHTLQEFELEGNLKTNLVWDVQKRQLSISLRQFVQTRMQVRAAHGAQTAVLWSRSCSPVLRVPPIMTASRAQAEIKYRVSAARSARGGCAPGSTTGVPAEDHTPLMEWCTHAAMAQGKLNTDTGEYHMKGHLLKSFQTNTLSLQVRPVDWPPVHASLRGRQHRCARPPALVRLLARAERVHGGAAPKHAAAAAGRGRRRQEPRAAAAGAGDKRLGGGEPAVRRALHSVPLTRTAPADARCAADLVAVARAQD